jgi:hypothetical protein
MPTHQPLGEKMIVSSQLQNSRIYGTVSHLLRRSNRTWNHETQGEGRCLPDSVAIETRRLAKLGVNMRDTPATDMAWRQWYVQFVRTHAGTLYGRGCVTRGVNGSLITVHLKGKTKHAIKCCCGIWIEPKNHPIDVPLPSIEQFLDDVAKYDYWMNSAFLNAAAWKFAAVGVKLYNLVVPGNATRGKTPDPNYPWVYWQLIQPCVTDQPELIKNSMLSINPTIVVEAEQIELNAAAVGQSCPGVHWQACLTVETVVNDTTAVLGDPGSIHAAMATTGSGVEPGPQLVGVRGTSPLNDLNLINAGAQDLIDAGAQGGVDGVSRNQQEVHQHKFLLKQLQAWREQFLRLNQRGNDTSPPPLPPHALFLLACVMRLLWNANSLRFD